VNGHTNHQLPITNHQNSNDRILYQITRVFVLMSGKGSVGLDFNIKLTGGWWNAVSMRLEKGSLNQVYSYRNAVPKGTNK